MCFQPFFFCHIIQKIFLQSCYMFSFQCTYALMESKSFVALQSKHSLIITFLFPPIFLLALYQIKAFHKFLAFILLHNIPSFVGIFHVCFKDSTSGGVDVQFVYSFYLILRVLLLLIFLGCNGAPFKNCSLVFIFLCVFTLLPFFAFVHPYNI